MSEIPDDSVVPKKDFTITLSPRSWEDKLGAIPWVAVLPRTRKVPCLALTVRGKHCKRTARYLFLDPQVRTFYYCQEHTQAEISSVAEERRLKEWERRVGLSTDRYEEES